MRSLRVLAALGLLLGLTATPQVAAAQSTVVTRGQTQCRQVALTFDAGSTAQSAQGILDALAAHRARSTFFLTGQWIDDFPALAARIAPPGHEVANHTDTHPDMTTISPTQMRSQLRTAEAKIIGATDLSPRPLWRPPYGSYNGTVLTVAGEEGYAWTIMWDIDTLDWQQPPAQTIVDRVLSRVQPGSIVLMHMGGDNTAAAVEQMLPALEQRGYMMVTVGEVLGLTRAGADFGGRVVYVQSGDTLFRIASCFNTTVPILAAANDISDPNTIAPGQRLYVPLGDEVTIRVDERKLNLAVPARVINGRTLAHVRAVAEALGAAVEWEGTTQKVTIRKETTTIEMTIGSTAAYVNGQPTTLDVAPSLVDSRTQVPVRFIAETLGAAVGWDQESRTVLITSS
ncbi:MAG TPA: stalk domain-containing protein [Symbiobacteriaceae bacterium]|nr:stalk domain-containing protein [Symbiobacteriaceae bacterium]